MNSDKSMTKTSKNGGENDSATPSIALLNQRLGISPAPRMLTPYEVDLLRQCAMEAMEAAHEVFVQSENKP